MRTLRVSIAILIVFITYTCKAQTDSVFQTLQNLQQIPVKYINKIDNKIDKYSNRISGKTEKTLAKLSRWENKIKSLLEKVSPEATTKLFGTNQTTFGSLLEKIKEGKAIAENYRVKYDSYRDKLTSSLKYLEQQKENLKTNIVKPVENANKKLTELEQDISNSEVVEKFIKERKKQLLDEAVKYIGTSKYLAKINKESYYYVETLRNYKEIFSDKKKAEQTALTLLNKIPAFQKFFRENGRLASLFGTSPNSRGASQSLGGMQTRSSVAAIINSRIATGGPTAPQYVSQNLQQAHNEFANLKNKMAKVGGNSSDTDIPDFKPNKQKTKTFFQRLEYGSNFQFAKNNSLVPTTADIALNIGYKLNDKSLIGIGVSYKMGLGSLQHISITHQGLGIRSFIDWKLKKQFFITGGFEMNYNAQFKNISQLKSSNDWQQSGLIGISKKLPIRTKWVKGTKLQLLYDMLYRQHIPVSQPVFFRIGYDFK